MRWKGKWSDTTMSILKYFKVKGAKQNSQKNLLILPDTFKVKLSLILLFCHIHVVRAKS